MKRMLSTAYEDLTLTVAQYAALTSAGSVQLDFSEYPEGLARLHNANVITIYTNPEHTGKTIVLQRQTQTETKAIFAAIEKENSTLKEYSIEVVLPVEGEGGAVNIGLAEVGGNIEGDVTITGNLAAAQINTPILTSTNDYIEAQKPVIEVMTGYSFEQITPSTEFTLELIYAGVVKNGNKITFAVAANVTRTATVTANLKLGRFKIPANIGALLYQSLIGSYEYLDVKKVPVAAQGWQISQIDAFMQKLSNETIEVVLPNTSGLSDLTLDTKYYTRYEATFLLSENLAA